MATQDEPRQSSVKLLGACLAGGRSLRFGSDKATALYRGTPLIEHALAALAEATEEVVVCGRGEAGWRSVRDRPAPDIGPLGGINAALALAAAEGFDGVLSLPCDTPTLRASSLAPLASQPDRACYFAGLPVCGYWPVKLFPELDELLGREGPRSMRGWTKLIGALLIPGPDVPNVNTREEWKALPP